MAQTFDIRFARSSGLTGFFEAPTNTFRWKGAGRLSIDPGGISIAVRRGLLSLFPRTCRVAAAALKEVLREGEALRVEFSTEHFSRVVVPFWVRDQDTAEEIVRLLPTTRTVELDHDTAGSRRSRFRIDWRALALCATAVLLAVAGMWTLQRSQAPPTAARIDDRTAAPGSATSATPLVDEPMSTKVTVPPRASPTGALDADPESAAQGTDASAAPREPVPLNPGISVTGAGDAVPIPAANAQAVRSTDATPAVWRGRVQVIDGVVPIVPAMPIYATARRQLDLFMSETAQLVEASRIAGDPRLDARWWGVTVRIANDPALDHPDLRALRDIELAVSRAWRGYLHAAGTPDADFALGFAERLTARVQLYVR